LSFRDIFKSFSGRTPPPVAGTAGTPLSKEFRARVLMLCAEKHQHTDFWEEIQKRMSYRLGKSQLAIHANPQSAGEDAFHFLQVCEDKYFLDFIEDIFVTQANFHADPDSFVEAINVFFEQDRLPYSLTPRVWRETPGRDFGIRSVLVAQPQVVRKDSDLAHVAAMEPMLELLRRPEFENANKEFMEAHQHFKRSEYADCLTKCSSALESVLKIVCDIKGWPYSSSDVGAPLIKKVLGHTGIETFFEKGLIQIAVLRNELSSAHGAGPQARVVSQGRAQYALNATAATALFIAAEAGV
jgi:hypothetical protein